MSALQRQLETASPIALAMLRATVAATIATSSAVAQQARSAATSNSASGGGPSLASASAEARSTVTGFMRDMYERKIFEDDLRFSSAEDKDAYRKREAETQRAIEAALKENTPEGNLRAAELATAQLKDAGAHGADKNPAYQANLDALTRTTENLRTQIGAAQERAGEDTRIAANQKASPVDAIAVPPDVLAALRSVAIPSQTDAGHGVSQRDPALAVSASRG